MHARVKLRKGHKCLDHTASFLQQDSPLRSENCTMLKVPPVTQAIDSQ
jgi:hypothetical protein